MNKLKTNIIVDVILFLFFIVSVFSGIVLLVFLKERGFQGGKILENLFLGLNRIEWIKMHNISSVGFVILTIIHLFLHGDWIKHFIFKKVNKK